MAGTDLCFCTIIDYGMDYFVFSRVTFIFIFPHRWHRRGSLNRSSFIFVFLVDSRISSTLLVAPRARLCSVYQLASLALFNFPQ